MGQMQLHSEHPHLLWIIDFRFPLSQGVKLSLQIDAELEGYWQ